MCLLFEADFDGHPIHVLHLRGRVAFLALELGAAAGYEGDGQRFVDQLVREWAPSLDEDDDVARLTGKELEALRRELPALPPTPSVLVLFATGAVTSLLRSRARFAGGLVRFLHDEVLSRGLTIRPAGGPTDDGRGGAAPAALPRPPFTLHVAAMGRESIPGTPMEEAPIGEAPTTALPLVAELDRARRQVRRLRALLGEVYGLVSGVDALERLAVDLRGEGLIDDAQWAALRVEAAEERLGRRLRAPLPTFGSVEAAPLAAA